MAGAFVLHKEIALIDLQSVIERTKAAGSMEDLQSLVIGDAYLQTPEADACLATAAADAEAAGDGDLAARLGALRQVISAVRNSPVFYLPDVPGSREAAGEIRAIMEQRREPPLPQGIDIENFFQVLSAFRQQSEEKGLTDLATAFGDLEQRARAAAALTAEPQEQELTPLAQTAVGWIDTDDWRASQGFLQDHPELLSDEASTMLSSMLQAAASNNQEQAAEVLSEHLRIIEQARTKGIAVVYADLVASEDGEAPATPSDPN